MKTKSLENQNSSSHLNKRRPSLALLHLSFCVVMLAAINPLFGQGETGSSHHPTYDTRQPLLLSLTEAYGLALAKIGTATNQVHCVSATCLQKDNLRSSGWTFTFSNTKGDCATVKVFFNKDVWIDPSTSMALK
jgi:hypothetical protein